MALTEVVAQHGRRVPRRLRDRQVVVHVPAHQHRGRLVHVRERRLRALHAHLRPAAAPVQLQHAVRRAHHLANEHHALLHRRLQLLRRYQFGGRAMNGLGFHPHRFCRASFWYTSTGCFEYLYAPANLVRTVQYYDSFHLPH